MAVRKLHSKQVGEVLETRNYDMFNLAPFNRSATKVQALVDSIRKHGFQTIILCDSKHRVADGQHRILAAKELGVPVHYSVRRDINVNDVQFLANLQTGKRWTPADFVEAFAKQGNDDYRRFQKFYETNKFSVTFALSLVSGNEQTLSLKKGTFTFSKYKLATTNKVASRINDILDTRDGMFRRLLKRTKVAPALKALVNHKNYKHRHFLAQLESGQFDYDIYAVGSTDSAKRMLLNIYNNGLSKTSTRKVSL